MAYQGISLIGSGNGAGGTVTLNTKSGVIDCGTLTSAAVTNFAVTLTNPYITTSSCITLTVLYGGTLVSAGIPIAQLGSISAGSCVINLLNIGLVFALNGSVKISFRID